MAEHRCDPDQTGLGGITRSRLLRLLLALLDGDCHHDVVLVMNEVEQCRLCLAGMLLQLANFTVTHLAETGYRDAAVGQFGMQLLALLDGRGSGADES